MNGQTTRYTLDTSTSLSAGLHAGLMQVLSDGETTYLYGLGRVSPTSTANPQSEISYFLGDALGSVRQMADESGAITLGSGLSPRRGRPDLGWMGVAAFQPGDGWQQWLLAVQ